MIKNKEFELPFEGSPGLKANDALLLKLNRKEKAEEEKASSGKVLKKPSQKKNKN